MVAYAWKKFKEGFNLNELVLSEDRGRVRVLTLNRPEVLNALNPAIVEALAERIEDVRNDSNVLALILTGSGLCETTPIQCISEILT